MLARVTRSRLVESIHDGAVAVVDPDGRLVASYGDIDRRFFSRSSIKPLQAQAAIEAGLDLPPEWLALACSSHAGAPVHIAIIRRILETGGLSEADLQTPPSWPERPHRDRLFIDGAREPLSIYHNCSGKHAGFLRACAASDWDLETYRDPNHPLQQAIASVLSEVTGLVDFEIGVDGCGAPTYAMNCVDLAKGFSRVGNDERFSGVFSAMHRFPRLTSGVHHADAEIAILTGGVAKRGAEGNLAVTIPGRGAIAVKIFDGAERPIGPVAASALRQLGWITPSQADALETATRVPVLGAGGEVGAVESTLELVAV